MGVYNNLSGTTSKIFTIGKTGTSFSIDTTKTITKGKETLNVAQFDKNILLDQIYFTSTGTSFINATDFTGNAASTSKLDHNVHFIFSGAFGAEASSNLAIDKTNTKGELSTTIKFDIKTLDAAKLTGTVPFNSIKAYFPPAETNSTNKYNGKEDIAARHDHKHDDLYAKINANANFIGDVTGSGAINEDISLTIGDGKVTDSKIVTISPSKITEGTIGTEQKKVNLIGDVTGNATTATKLIAITKTDKGETISPFTTTENKPIRFLNGIPVEINTPLDASITGNATSADKATKDSLNKDITRYIENVSVSNATLTFTKGNGKTISPITINKVVDAEHSSYTDYIGSKTTDTTTGKTNYSFADIKEKFDLVDKLDLSKVTGIKVGPNGKDLSPVSGIVQIPVYTEGATKVEKSTSNGKIKINGTETEVYTLPTASASTLGGVVVDDTLKNSTNPVQNKAINSKLTTIESSIGTNANAISALQEKDTTQDGLLAGLRTDVDTKALNSDLTKLSEIVTSNKSTTDNRIGLVEEDVKTLQESPAAGITTQDISDWENEVGAKAATAVNAGNITILQGSVKDNSDAINTEKGRIDSLNTVVNDASTGLVKKVSDLDTTVKTKANSSDLDETNKVVGQHTATLGTHDAQIRANAGKISAVETKLSNVSNVMDFVGAVPSLPTDLSKYQKGDVIVVTEGENKGKEYVLNEVDNVKSFVEFGNTSAQDTKLAELVKKDEKHDELLTGLRTDVDNAVKTVSAGATSDVIDITNIDGTSQTPITINNVAHAIKADKLGDYSSTDYMRIGTDKYLKDAAISGAEETNVGYKINLTATKGDSNTNVTSATIPVAGSNTLGLVKIKKFLTKSYEPQKFTTEECAFGAPVYMNKDKTLFVNPNRLNLHENGSASTSESKDGKAPRDIETDPKEYRYSFIARGLKRATTLNLTNFGHGGYASVIGWNAWGDQSGGGSYEVASTTENPDTSIEIAGSGNALFFRHSKAMKGQGNADWDTWKEIATYSKVDNTGTRLIDATGLNASVNIGSNIKPIYFSNGIPTESIGNVGSGIKPIYMENGELKASSSTVGTTTKPVYLNEGTITECSEFAEKDHNHDDKYLKLAGGQMTGPITLADGDGQGLLMSETANINVKGTVNTILGFLNSTFIIGNGHYGTHIRGKSINISDDNKAIEITGGGNAKLKIGSFGAAGTRADYGLITTTDTAGTRNLHLQPANAGPVEIGGTLGSTPTSIEKVKLVVHGKTITEAILDKDGNEYYQRASSPSKQANTLKTTYTVQPIYLAGINSPMNNGDVFYKDYHINNSLKAEINKLYIGPETTTNYIENNNEGKLNLSSINISGDTKKVVNAIIKPNSSQSEDIDITLPSTSGTLITSADLNADLNNYVLKSSTELQELNTSLSFASNNEVKLSHINFNDKNKLELVGDELKLTNILPTTANIFNYNNTSKKLSLTDTIDLETTKIIVKKNVIPTTNNSINLGSSDNKFSTVYATSFKGTSDAADKLTTDAGSKTLPVYFSGGIPVACSTTLGVSITGNALTASKATADKNNKDITEYISSVTGATGSKDTITVTNGTGNSNDIIIDEVSNADHAKSADAFKTSTAIGSSSTPIYISNEGKPTVVTSIADKLLRQGLQAVQTHITDGNTRSDQGIYAVIDPASNPFNQTADKYFGLINFSYKKSDALNPRAQIAIDYDDASSNLAIRNTTSDSTNKWNTWSKVLTDSNITSDGNVELKGMTNPNKFKLEVKPNTIKAATARQLVYDKEGTDTPYTTADNKPIYFENGAPKEITKDLAVSITGNAATASSIDLSSTGSGTNTITITAGEGKSTEFTVNNVVNASNASNAGTATYAKNILGGKVNQLVYQTNTSTTGFIDEWKTSVNYEQLLMVDANGITASWKQSPYLKLSGGTLTGDLDLGAHDIKNVNKLYINKVKDGTKPQDQGISFESTKAAEDTSTETKYNTIYVDSSNNLKYFKNHLAGAAATQGSLIITGDNLGSNITPTMITGALASTQITEIGTGVLSVARGGTGASTHAENQLLLGNNTDNLVSVTKGTEGQFLKQGAKVPEFSNITVNDISGVLPVKKGGTGKDKFTSHNSLIISGNTDAAPLETITTKAGALFGTSANTAPVFRNITMDDVSGILPVSKGGTGASTHTKNQLLLGNGSDVIKSVAAGSTGQFIKQTTTGPLFACISTTDISDLNSWAGSASITNVGTITSGTWTASPIGLEYLDEKVKTHINSGSSHLPSTTNTNDGKVLITNAKGNAEWSNTIGTKTSTITTAGNLTVGGNLTVQGSTTVLESSQLKVTDQLIELASGRTETSTPIADYAGIFVDKYDGEHAGALVFDNTGTAYVGDVIYNSDTKQITSANSNTSSSEQGLQPLATRSTALITNDILKWDNTNKTIIKATNLKDEQYALKNHNHDDKYASSDHSHTLTLSGNITGSGTVSGAINTIISDNAVTTSKIKDLNVTSGKIAASAVTTDKIADLNVTTEKIADSAITTIKIKDLNVTSGKIAASAVTTDKIADLNVTTSKIADGAVTTPKIKDLNVTTGKIADLNVTTSKIADGAVTTDKIADFNVTTEKINTNAVTDDKIKEVSPAKITAGTIGSSTVKVNLVGDVTGNADTADAFNTSTAIGSSTLPIYINNEGKPIACSTTLGVSITGNAATATSAAWLKVDTEKALNADQFIASKVDKSLAIYSKSESKTTSDFNKVYITDYPKVEIGNGSNIVHTFELATSDNATKFTANAIEISNGINTVQGTFTPGTKQSGYKYSNGVLKLNIAPLLTDIGSGDFVSFNAAENIPSKKSFGQGITLGEVNQTSNHSYSDAGCTMNYNSTKKCVQFIFK